MSFNTWTCRCDRGTSLLVVKISVPVFGTELTIELAKLNVSRNEAAKGFKDFHVVDEHTEIDFGETVVSFSVPLIRYQIQWGSI